MRNTPGADGYIRDSDGSIRDCFHNSAIMPLPRLMVRIAKQRFPEVFVETFKSLGIGLLGLMAMTFAPLFLFLAALDERKRAREVVKDQEES